MPDFRDLLPNPPHKGLPTPRKWEQTWKSFEKRDPLAGGVVIGTTGLGTIMGAAVGVGVGMATMASPATAIPVALGIMGSGTAAGAALGGVILKAVKKD